MQSLFAILIISWNCLSFGKSSYIWSNTEEWSPCSKPCGQGEETQMHICLKKTRYRTLEFSDPSKCAKIQIPIKKRNCTLGECNQTPEGSYVWQVGSWSSCPKNCGGLSIQNRDVNCVLMTSKGEYLMSKVSKCDDKIEPTRFITCAKVDCPPNFMTSKWEKCPESVNCRPTIRRRKVSCVSLLSTGKLKIQSSGICYGMRQKPPSTWMMCDSKLEEHCKKTGDGKSYGKVEIKKENSEIYQMRHMKRLNVFIGQSAHVFAFTRLSLFCPVTKFHKSQIKWQHGNMTYEYKGISKSRIKVNRKGILIIREFHLGDQGVWKCIAGKYSAESVLKLEQPSSGYDNWLRRHANQNYGMLNEESNISFIRPESLLWIKTDWTPCSLTCDNINNNTGYQTRKVTCEKIENQYYKVIDDKLCSPTKPISWKKCKSSDQCPTWKVFKKKTDQCSDICVNVGLAKTNTEITCQFNNKTVDSSFCDREKLPIVDCLNPNCQISYLYGPWSQCSLSCSNQTNIGFRSRTMQCVWKHSEKPANSLCQQHQLIYNMLTKPCRVPKCILGCKDLNPACSRQSKYRCRSSLFYNFCCAFCKKQFS